MLKGHRGSCQCIACKNGRGEKHKVGCRCISCLSKTGELHTLHKANCKCNCCTSKRGEDHRADCQCSACKAHRGEYADKKYHMGMAGLHHSKESKARISLSKTGGKHSKKAKKRMSEAYHANYKERISAVLRVVCKRPNKFEARAMAYLDVIYPGKFTYTGNGTMIVNNRSADAFSEELNTIALFNGVYWHLKKNNYEITDENKRIVESIEAVPFLKGGYKVLFIWEDELDKLVEKVTK